MNELETLKAQLQIALKALNYYADFENYGQGESFAELSRISDKDLEYTTAHRGFDLVGGKQARLALLEIMDVTQGKQHRRDRRPDKL